MFSICEAKIVPFASVARQVTGFVGRSRRTGPERSVGDSARVQVVSSLSAGSAWVSVVEVVVVRVVGGGEVRLRFFGLGSPLNESAFTIVVFVW